MMSHECLSCRVGTVALAVPVNEIDQIIDYQLSPLPLAESWVAGVGLHAQTMFVSISLNGMDANRKLVVSRKGLLIKSSAAERFALEVDSVANVITVTGGIEPMIVPQWRIPKGWLLQAVTATGQPLALLNANAVREQIAEQYVS